MKLCARGILLGFFLAGLCVLGGCETFKGTGRDISNVGKLISGD